MVNAASISYLPQVITSIMQLTNGKPREEVLAQWEGDAKTAVAKAIKTISLSKPKKWYWPF